MASQNNEGSAPLTGNRPLEACRLGRHDSLHIGGSPAKSKAYRVADRAWGKIKRPYKYETRRKQPPNSALLQAGGTKWVKTRRWNALRLTKPEGRRWEITQDVLDADKPPPKRQQQECQPRSLVLGAKILWPTTGGGTP